MPMADYKSGDAMTKHEFNLKESRNLFAKHRDILQKRECYQNISRIVGRQLDLFSSGKWKVAYGYYTTSPKVPHILARHCFIIDENNQVIDPTVLLNHDNNDELKIWEYFTIKIFKYYSDYLHALVSEEYYDLTKTLRPYDQQAILWSRQNGYWLLD